MSNTPRLALPLLAAAQAQKHVTHNEALMALDGLTHLMVLDRNLSAPPATPASGSAYIIGPSPTGVWAGRVDQIARFQDGAWSYAAPLDGWLCWIDDEALLAVFNDGQWSVATNFQNIAMLGIASTADATNKLSVAAPASLFNHGGTSHQMKINKSAAASTASITFQTGFSGRAEIGTTGDDKLHIKVSSNGSTWTEAQVIDQTNGNIGIGVVAPSTKLHVNGPIRCGSSPKASLPAAATVGAGTMIYVTDEIGGAVIAFSDGAAWRRLTDRVVVS
jgi:hypothetical protein